MVKMRYLLGILALCGGMINTADAQVFSGTQQPAAQSYNPITDGQQTKPSTSAQKDSSLSNGSSTNADQNADENASPDGTEADDDSFSPVETNFNGDKKEEFVNEEPRVFHFKIVNGKVSVDDNTKRTVLIFYDNYQIHRGFDKLIKCTIRVNVLNDLTEKITSLGFKLKWPDIMTSVEMSQLKPGITTYTDLMLLGEGCLKLDKTPTIEVNRCRVKGMTQEECADTIKWFPKKQR